MCDEMEVVTGGNISIAFFGDVTPCSLVELKFSEEPFAPVFTVWKPRR